MIFLQPVDQDGAHVFHGLAAGVDLTRQRETEAAIRPHQDLTLQVRLLPDGHFENIAGLQLVSQPIDRSRHRLLDR